MCLQCCNSTGPSSKNTAPKILGAVHSHGKQRSSRGAGCTRRWISVQRPSQRRKEIRWMVSYQRQLLNVVVICWATAKQSLFALLDINNSGTDGSWWCGMGVGRVWRGEGLLKACSSAFLGTQSPSLLYPDWSGWSCCGTWAPHLAGGLAEHLMWKALTIP